MRQGAKFFARTSRLAHHAEQDEWGLYSQNGEDGVLLSVLESTGLLHENTSDEDLYFVEFGVEDGYECNTRILREDPGGLVCMDGSHENQTINLYKEFITQKTLTCSSTSMGSPKNLFF